jgi:hypothetical protein
LGSFNFAFRETDVLKGPVNIQNVCDILHTLLCDRVVAEVEHFKRFHCGLVGSQHMADLLHIVVLDIVGTQKQDLKLVVALQTIV